MTKEKQKFLFQQKIKLPKTENGKTTNLKQEIELEVNWEDWTRGKIERQVVEIEKDGKKYKFSIEGKARKGFFRDKMGDFNLGPHYEPDEPQKDWIPAWGGHEERLIPLQRRTTSWFIVGGFALFLIGVIVYFLWKKKQK